MSPKVEQISIDNFFQKVEIPFENGKEVFWAEISDKISVQPQIQSKTTVRSISFIKMTAAAILLLFIGTTLFLKLYTSTIQAEKGEHVSHILPDGSTIELNAASCISYHPYWWHIEREISFEGEAFFEIEKGRDFIVASGNGETKVLGTSFNIFARKDKYNVYCETGSVKVSSSKSDVEFIIKPGEMAVIDNQNNKGSIESIEAIKVLSWKENKFNFTSELLLKVFEELERQYNVSIYVELEHPSKFIYTGYFEKSISINSTLDLICKSFDFTFVKLNDDSYKVLQNNQ